MASLGGRIGLVLDAGPTTDGVESTIVAPGERSLRILRPGPVTAEQLATSSGLPVTGAGTDGTIEAPGQLASHYRPEKPVRLNAAGAEPGEYMIGFGGGKSDFDLSPSRDLVEAAANLFAALHEADAGGARAIAIAPIPPEGIGAAINDRLARAAVR